MSSSDSIDQLCIDHGVDQKNIPKHIAIIMDGNGRWANQRLLPRKAGHKTGQKNVKKTLINCLKLGVKVLTVYVFSTENWRRPKTEVEFLLGFLKKSIADEIDALIAQGVRIRFLGDRSLFKPELQEIFKDAEERTCNNTAIQLNVMVNYGARLEIIQAIQKYVSKGGDIDKLTESDISNSLYCNVSGDPDILIRTGGDYRISNFMLWQIAYTELFFLPVCWPDFDLSHLLSVIGEFQSRDRRFGGLTS